ncbi:MAG: DUF1992 domain-containing protein [Nitrospirota bacterium]|jgi:hypothetical protein
MRAIARIAEERIRKAAEEGAFVDLPGAGKPLDLREDAFVPEDLRMAYRMLKNAGCIPPELELQNEIMSLRTLVESIDDDQERLRALRVMNRKILELNLMRPARPVNLDAFPAYEQALFERLYKKKA